MRSAVVIKPWACMCRSSSSSACTSCLRGRTSAGGAHGYMGHSEHEARKEGCTTPLSTNKVLHRLWCPRPGITQAAHGTAYAHAQQQAYLLLHTVHHGRQPNLHKLRHEPGAIDLAHTRERLRLVQGGRILGKQRFTLALGVLLTQQRCLTIGNSSAASAVGRKPAARAGKRGQTDDRREQRDARCAGGALGGGGALDDNGCHGKHAC